MKSTNYCYKTNDQATPRKRWSAAAALVTIAALLTLSLGDAVAQSTASAKAVSQVEVVPTKQDTARRPAVTYSYVVPQLAFGSSAENSQVPQDIRIMQRIVQTYLGEVEAPALPALLEPDADAPETGVSYVGRRGSGEAAVWTLSTGSGNRVYSIGGRDVTGFYMQGYGYLFTVRWQVGRSSGGFMTADAMVVRAQELNELAEQARRSAAERQGAEARAADQAEQALEREREQLEAREAAWAEWSEQYRSLLGEALRGVVAQYGSTLQRATPDESITFIADFGGGETETVTVSARRGDLEGAGLEQNLAAVRLAKGETGVSPMMRTELKIMEEIIDSSLQGETGGDDIWVAYGVENRYFGGSSSYQYVPGYGVIFRKSARLNMATQVIRDVNVARTTPRAGVVVTPTPLREQIEQSTEEQREAYTAHLADLKEQTASILATYGPTLTQLGANDWVGVFYNVGSAAGLLEGGISNFLVQARMSDIREAGSQADGGTWLLSRLVTNERQD